jgi:hypothetical protein
MHPNNTFGKRRTSGWADRRRYFKRLIERASVNGAPRNEEVSKKQETAKKD